ncbi:hypothetical protein [Paraflavitalea speifideaquila]|uniref:hypothetical protein n=1 Tax=Paraflavitalea speifideaquila TaxID=3076558 RepID=UPI0028EDB1FB|nr:hypothetical protein [Paraflavitalea speifideiaquila]
MKNDKLTWKEQLLYGNSRLGIYRYDTLPPVSPAVVTEDGTYVTDSIMSGRINYELVNHLSNVIGVISDKKHGIVSSTDSTKTAYYAAEVLSVQDYYPFGMAMAGRGISGPGCHEVVEDLTEVKASSNLDSGAVQDGLEVNHNGVRWGRMTTTSTITLYNQAVKMTNGGSSDGVLAIVPISQVEPNTTYVMEFDITEKSSGISYFSCQAHSSGNDQYRATTRKTGLGHHSVLVTTPATPITFFPVTDHFQCCNFRHLFCSRQLCAAEI